MDTLATMGHDRMSRSHRELPIAREPVVQIMSTPDDWSMVSREALSIAIQDLSDQEAVRAMALLAEELHPPSDTGQLTSELVAQLEADVGSVDVGDHDLAPAHTDGDLARQVLRYAADNPDWTSIVTDAVHHAGSPAERFDPLTLTVTTIAIVVLQTDIRINRSASGKWTFSIHKKAMKDSVLGQIIQVLLSRLPTIGSE